MVVLQEWQHIRTFLTSNEDFAKTSTQRLLQIFDVDTNKLKIELASVMEMEEFVKSTYTLEGDGTLILIAYEKLQMLQAFIRVQLPYSYRCGTAAVSSECCRTAKMVQLWL